MRMWNPKWKMQIPAEREESAHAKLSWYIKLAYPNAIFNTDMSGIKLTMNQAIKAKTLRSSRAFPDIVIYEQRHGFGALFIELKREKTRIWKKDGTLVADKHIQEQAFMINRLNQQGYCAKFAVGFAEARKLIDWYMDGDKK